MVIVVEHQKPCSLHVSGCRVTAIWNAQSLHAHLKLSLADWSGSLHLTNRKVILKADRIRDIMDIEMNVEKFMQDDKQMARMDATLFLTETDVDIEGKKDGCIAFFFRLPWFWPLMNIRYSGIYIPELIFNLILFCVHIVFWIIYYICYAIGSAFQALYQ